MRRAHCRHCHVFTWTVTASSSGAICARCANIGAAIVAAFMEFHYTRCERRELEDIARKEPVKVMLFNELILSRVCASDQFVWRIDVEHERETFEALNIHFNIHRAKRIIALAPRGVFMVNIAPYKAYLELVELEHKGSKGRVYDLDFPLIIATLANGGTFLIDGWHRLAKAVECERRFLPAVFLTKEETKVVRR